MFRSGFLGRSPLFLASAALALGLAVDASAAQDKITLSFANWASAEAATRPGIEQVIAAFEKANPDIEIKSEAISFSEIARQMVLRIRSGNPPDVAQVAGNDTLLLAAAGGLEPIDALAGPDVMSNLKPGSTAGLDVDGKLIAFPWTQAPAGFW